MLKASGACLESVRSLRVCCYSMLEGYSIPFYDILDLQFAWVSLCLLRLEKQENDENTKNDILDLQPRSPDGLRGPHRESCQGAQHIV